MAILRDRGPGCAPPALANSFRGETLVAGPDWIISSEEPSAVAKAVGGPQSNRGRGAHPPAGWANKPNGGQIQNAVL